MQFRKPKFFASKAFGFSPHNTWMQHRKILADIFSYLVPTLVNSRFLSHEIVNPYLHYPDSSLFSKAVLLAFETGDVNSQEVFLLSDGQPLSRQQICESALLNPLFQGTVGQKI